MDMTIEHEVDLNGIEKWIVLNAKEPHTFIEFNSLEKAQEYIKSY